MVQSRQRKPRNELIIRTKKNWIVESVLTLLSTLIWIYFIYALLFFITAFFGFKLEVVNILKIILNLKNKEIIQFVLNVLFFTLIITVLLYGWALYNKLRYGNLNRRRYPEHTSAQDIMNLDYITLDTYHQLQDAKMITFERNPIVDKKVENR